MAEHVSAVHWPVHVRIGSRIKVFQTVSSIVSTVLVRPGSRQSAFMWWVGWWVALWPCLAFIRVLTPCTWPYIWSRTGGPRLAC